jgi:hypothetical protein
MIGMDTKINSLWIFTKLLKTVVLPRHLENIRNRVIGNKITQEEYKTKRAAIDTRINILGKILIGLQGDPFKPVEELLDVGQWVYLRDIFNRPGLVGSIMQAYTEEYEISVWDSSERERIKKSLHDILPSLQQYIDLAQARKYIKTHADAEEQSDITNI